ncbi:uncharacterized protein Smp_204040 [Schistosoma mansoni]|uniref:Uncharacterized protein n=1 Tax=Schistosoma mansoni TaxID=6183 RepID=G4VT59_SCHMA|nr:uncharacterized protein Smp_204040 [Schistosoma mansoni]|eukprot:XP_018655572.1 uncharacterized protein Smp_204040 [Schistosoma mansoni]
MPRRTQTRIDNLCVRTHYIIGERNERTHIKNGTDDDIFRYDPNNHHMLIITIMSYLHRTWNYYFCS